MILLLFHPNAKVSIQIALGIKRMKDQIILQHIHEAKVIMTPKLNKIHSETKVSVNGALRVEDPFLHETTQENHSL
jgi:hypothetical protein